MSSHRAGGLNGPIGLTFGPNGDLFVASDSSPGQVLEYDGITGEFKGIFAQGGGLVGGTGLEFGVGPQGDLFVADFVSKDVLRYNGYDGAPWVFLPPA